MIKSTITKDEYDMLQRSVSQRLMYASIYNHTQDYLRAKDELADLNRRYSGKPVLNLDDLVLEVESLRSLVKELQAKVEARG